MFILKTRKPVESTYCSIENIFLDVELIVGLIRGLNAGIQEALINSTSHDGILVYNSTDWFYIIKNKINSNL